MLSSVLNKKQEYYEAVMVIQVNMNRCYSINNTKEYISQTKMIINIL